MTAMQLMKRTLTLCLFLAIQPLLLAADPIVLDLWPEGQMPGEPALVEGEERDLTKTDDKLIAGEPIIKLGHVTRPQVEVFLPPADKANGSAVVVCPGGGFHILAWDLEGTEVAEWFNSLGVAAIVLKYRVPTRPHGNELVTFPNVPSFKLPAMAVGPVMDAQRAMSLVNENADEWKIDPDRIGILGFSAGGFTAVMASLADGRLYELTDGPDEASVRPRFALVIYPGGLVEENGQLKSFVSVTEKTPPMFFAHAADDRVSCLNSVALFTALKLGGIPAELHVYESGGHGYGLRRTDVPVTRWTDRAEEWLEGQGLLGSEP